MYSTKEDLKDVPREVITKRMDELELECAGLEDELRMANFEWDLLDEWVVEEDKSLVALLEMGQDDVKEGRVMSSESFKAKLNKRKEGYLQQDQ